MGLYEHTLIAKQDLSTPDLENLENKYKDIITKTSGKVIKIEKSELNQLITEGINIVKPGENITVTTVSKTKDKKGEYWECSPLNINETKSNSIICSQLPSMEQGSKMLLEKKILNSNISLAIFYKN